MMKSIVITLTVFLIIGSSASAQLSRIVKNVKSSASKELLGDKKQDSDNKPAKVAPEPACACDPAELVIDLGGRLKLDYTEINIKVGDEGSLLVNDRLSSDYYIVLGGVIEGPYAAGNPKVVEFGIIKEETNDIDKLLLTNRGYISRSGEKFMISFMGKNYGPFARIDRFIVTKSKDKFAAMVVENVMITEDQGKKMDELMKNAKSDQERIALAMQMTQQMQTNVLNVGASTIMPKFISNIPGATFDPIKSMGGQLNGSFKYDDILLLESDKIKDLKGNTLLTYKLGTCNTDEMFVKSDNTKYVCYSNGTLTFSDNTTISEVFNPHLLKADGRTYLAYMYYSPKRNSIMQCKIPF